MKFKEFVAWANARACDGCWDMNDVIWCTTVISKIRRDRKLPWTREKYWQEYFAEETLREIVIPINRKIKEVYGTEVQPL